MWLDQKCMDKTQTCTLLVQLKSTVAVKSHLCIFRIMWDNFSRLRRTNNVKIGGLHLELAR